MSQTEDRNSDSNSLNPVASDVFTMPLDLEPAADVVSGHPRTATHELGTIGETEVGIWELTEGVVRDTEVEEIFVVLSGSGQIDFEDGRTLLLQPGTAVRLHEGQRTTWTITEALRKVYVA